MERSPERINTGFKDPTFAVVAAREHGSIQHKHRPVHRS